MACLELNCCDVLEPFFELGLPVPGCETCECRVRQDSALFRIEMVGGKRPDCIIMLAQFGRSREVDASDWYSELLREPKPY